MVSVRPLEKKTQPLLINVEIGRNEFDLAKISEGNNLKRWCYLVNLKSFCDPLYYKGARRKSRSVD